MPLAGAGPVPVPVASLSPYGHAGSTPLAICEQVTGCAFSTDSTLFVNLTPTAAAEPPPNKPANAATTNPAANTFPTLRPTDPSFVLACPRTRSVRRHVPGSAVEPARRATTTR